jgi:hypothetical protein
MVTPCNLNLSLSLLQPFYRDPVFLTKIAAENSIYFKNEGGHFRGGEDGTIFKKGVGAN